MPSKRSFLLRIPPALWDDIKRWADDDLRSVNAQIEWILREAVAKRRRRRGAEESSTFDADDENEQTNASDTKRSYDTP